MEKGWRTAVLIICISVLLPAWKAGARDDTPSTPEPYTEEEFPLWAKDLRRFEVVLIGSLPFTFLYTSLSYSLIRYGVNGFDPAYAPSLQAGAETVPMTRNEQIGVLLSGIGAAVLVAIADQIIIHVKRNRAEEDAADDGPRQQ